MMSQFFGVEKPVKKLKPGYQGEQKDGRQHGWGIQIFLNGDSYEGHWFDGRIHGYGCYKYANGAAYTGEFKNQVRHGRGRYEFINGDVYDGDWLNGKRTGRGVFYYGGIDANERYEGDFVEGKMQGRGTYYFPNGDVYHGDFRNNTKRGKGTITYMNGDTYQGSWADDLPHGVGMFVWEDGTKYEGAFSRGVIADRWCPASPVEDGKIIPYTCEFFKGQCRRCGHFDKPCPVGSREGDLVPCEIVNGQCRRCGKTEKLSEAPPLSDPYVFGKQQSLTSGTSGVRDKLKHRKSISTVLAEERDAKAREETEREEAQRRKAAEDKQRGRERRQRELERLREEEERLLKKQREEEAYALMSAEERKSPFVQLAKEKLDAVKSGLGLAIADFSVNDADSGGKMNVVKVVTVKVNSSASAAGIRRSDRIVRLGGNDITTKAAFLMTSSRMVPGEKGVVEVVRGPNLQSHAFCMGCNLLPDDYIFLKRAAEGNMQESECQRVQSVKLQDQIVAWPPHPDDMFDHQKAQLYTPVPSTTDTSRRGSDTEPRTAAKLQGLMGSTGGPEGAESPKAVVKHSRSADPKPLLSIASEGEVKSQRDAANAPSMQMADPHPKTPAASDDTPLQSGTEVSTSESELPTMPMLPVDLTQMASMTAASAIENVLSTPRHEQRSELPDAQPTTESAQSNDPVRNPLLAPTRPPETQSDNSSEPVEQPRPERHEFDDSPERHEFDDSSS